jgi:hypothetical protein
MAKKDKAIEPTVTTKRSGIPTHGVFGLILMFAAISTLIADYFVFFGTDDPVIKAMLIPNLLAVGTFFVIKAVK